MSRLFANIARIAAVHKKHIKENLTPYTRMSEGIPNSSLLNISVYQIPDVPLTLDIFIVFICPGGCSLTELGITARRVTGEVTPEVFSA